MTKTIAVAKPRPVEHATVPDLVEHRVLEVDLVENLAGWNAEVEIATWTDQDGNTSWVFAYCLEAVGLKTYFEFPDEQLLHAWVQENWIDAGINIQWMPLDIEEEEQFDDDRMSEMKLTCSQVIETLNENGLEMADDDAFALLKAIYDLGRKHRNDKSNDRSATERRQAC